ncbi:hypothetical protein FQR65_LT14656 [Abscondita terminalis]|nr:hypothetical protein FQR65_LT14656 [Abscondita terminalis]
MRLREKIKLLQFLAIDRILCLGFNKRLAECNAEEFVEKILVEKLGIKGLIVGDDFRFGKGRQGDFTFLQKLGHKYGFKVFSTPTVLFEDERIGSSRVRNAVKEGDFKLAALLLGRPFRLSGRVIYGDQRGRLLGFPTANIGLHRKVIPLQGVFVVNVYGLAVTALPGVANCGKRPTINGLKNLLEVHLFDFDERNIQKQAKNIKKDKNILNPNKLGIIFAGANDLVTLGYDDSKGVERAIQGNIQKQAKNIKKDKNILNPNKLGIIFAGANDLVTLGYDDSKGVERAIQGNIQKQAKNIKKDKNILNPNKLGIIFAGANDLVTLGYDDSKGVERAIQGMAKTIEILTDQTKKADFNFLKNLVLIGLPDISETPRFAHKSEKEKLRMKRACQEYNNKLQELTSTYQYINFNLYTMFSYKNKKCLDFQSVKNIKKGVVIIGEGKERTAIFINDGKFLTKKVNIKLSNEQLAIFSQNGEIIRDETNGNLLDEFVNKVVKKAKLNINLKILDIGKIFNKICQNPEAYEFTSGCGVYYLPKSETLKVDESLISHCITEGNAVVLKETDNGFLSYLIKDWKINKKKKIVFGDSLSDEGRKYSENVCCCIPFKWFLYHSNYNNFTNGHTWAFIFANILNEILEKKSTWLGRDKENYFNNVAEGGATTFNYRNITSFFRYFKGFILSFFLGNIQKQAKNIKKDKNILNPNKLGIIFAGANDLVTLGYDDSKGVERAIQGMAKTIEILTDQTKKADFNFLKNLVLIGLPDISETPRFAHKSEKEKLRMKRACQEYNNKLQELTSTYQYINFNLYTMFSYKNKKCLDFQSVKNIKKGVVIIGEGKERTAIFINDGKFLTKKVNIKLSNEQLAIFSQNGEIIRDETNGNLLDEFVNKVVKKAKLNINLKILDIGKIFNKICQNPEAYEFTSGCGVYYLPKSETLKVDESLISHCITEGNAVVLKETDNGFLSYLIKDGKLIKEQDQTIKVEIELSIINQFRLREKIKQHRSKNEIIKLVGMEDIHDLCIINIIQSAVECYKKEFHKEIELTAVDDSVLEAIKKKYLNQDTIFWDDLHPARRVHDILASEIVQFIESNYSLNNPSNFRDDSVVGIKPRLPESPNAEAPGSLSSVPSLLYSNTTFRM